MAIEDSFNINRATHSQSYAYKCWYNYNYGNNTMGISSRDMGKIITQWQNELSNWRANALDDENKYEIPDDDFSKAYDDGKTLAKDKTGYSASTASKAGMVLRANDDLAVSGFGTAANIVGTDILGKKIGDNIAGKTVNKTLANIETKRGSVGKIKSEDAAGNKGWIIAAPLSMATGIAYQANKPNEEQKEACDELQNEMANADMALGEAQEEMEEARSESEDLSDEAEGVNEDANSGIEDKKSKFDMYRRSYEALKAKLDGGEELTPEEKELMKTLVPLMQQMGVDIEGIQEDTSDEVSELYETIGEYQATYDESAETVAEVQGLTDYAASFDDMTRTMCYVEAGVQTLNAASGAKAAYQAGRFAASGGWFTAWGWAFVGMGITGSTLSGFGAKQQFQWAGEVGTEIDMRKNTQDLNDLTSEVYDESIQDYEGSMEIVEGLELAIPDDIEAPEEVPVDNSNPAQNGTDIIQPPKKDKDDKK